MSRLRITEIFYSIQGEGLNTGLPTVFVRLTGCPLRCGYCDTAYAFKGGEWMELADVLAAVASFQVHHVTVTGGEPLAQESCTELLTALCDAGYEVSLETSGALDIGNVDSRVIRVVDLKTPGSGESDKNRMQNLPLLRASDQLKFVICNREDYDWSRHMVQQHQLGGKCTVLFSPANGTQSAAQLAQWILDDRLPVRFQIQLHKVLWGDVPGR